MMGMIKAVDCRHALDDLKGESVSLVVTDPPYFLDGMGTDWNNEKLAQRCASTTGTVGGIPKGMKFDRQQGKDLQNFLSPIAEKLFRVLKPGAFCCLFSQARLVHRTAVSLEDTGFEIRDMLAWQYEGQAKAQRVLYHIDRNKNLSEEEKKTWRDGVGDRKTPQVKPQIEPIVLAQKPRIGTFAENWMRHRCGLVDFNMPVIQSDRFPGQLIPCPKVKHKIYGHITPKPVPLLRHLIRMFSHKDALVLDPFAGSGTTGVAAYKESRSFLGFEIDPEMAQKANQRIQDAKEEEDGKERIPSIISVPLAVPKTENPIGITERTSSSSRDTETPMNPCR